MLWLWGHWSQTLGVYGSKILLYLQRWSSYQKTLPLLLDFGSSRGLCLINKVQKFNSEGDNGGKTSIKTMLASLFQVGPWPWYWWWRPHFLLRKCLSCASPSSTFYCYMNSKTERNLFLYINFCFVLVSFFSFFNFSYFKWLLC